MRNRRRNIFQEFLQEVKEVESTEVPVQERTQFSVRVEVPSQKESSIWQEFQEFLSSKFQKKGKGRIYQTFCIAPQTMELLDEVYSLLNRYQRVTKTDLLDFALYRTLSLLKKELQKET